MKTKEMDQFDKLKKIGILSLLIVCVICCAVLLKAYFEGKFDSVEAFQQYVGTYGIFAPVMLGVIQAMQVVFPVLPGCLGSAVGAAMFGCAGGFFCNYTGISVGSIIAFILARKYGKVLVDKMFPKMRFEKLARWASESKFFTIILFVVMLLPLFPDDFFCYFTGLTKMSFRKFALIIILGKPWCILAYSIIFSRTIT